jgi:streptogramin lyase
VNARRVAFGTLIVGFIGAASANAASHVAPPLTIRVEPAGGSWRVLPPATSDGLFIGIVQGPDGKMWLTDFYHGLVSVDSNGKRTLYPLTFTRGGVKHRFMPAYVAVGSDRKFYITGCIDSGARCAAIGVATTSGALSVIATPSGESARFSGLALGPDGNVWFTESGHVAKVTPAGRISEYAYPPGEMTNVLSGVTAGSDGSIWFTEFDKVAVGKIDPATGAIVEYSLQAQNINCGISGMMAAGDGNLYFGCSTGFVQVTTAGVGTYFYTGYAPSNGASEYALGPDGFVWGSALGALQRFDYTQNTLTIYPTPDGSLTLYGSAIGPDGEQWIVSEDGTVYVFTLRDGRPRSPR